MAFVALPRLINLESKKCSFKFACYPSFGNMQRANISSVALRDPNIKKPAPWPYKTKKYNFLRALIYENTLKRFDENTKFIVVDGNIGAGKSTFAKELADAFGMLHFKEPTIDEFFINPYGYDIRELNPIAPPSFQHVDMQTYYSNPHHHNVAKLQPRIYILRLAQYIDALAHLFNSGQGVVLERSPYSDFVFLEAMFAAGYIRSEVREVYRTICERTLDELLRPHLIIYLDISADVALQRIKQRNDPIEVNSKVLTKDYLECIEHYYKHVYLKEQEQHSELLIYDWSHYGDVEVVVEDIERLDFDKYTVYDTKLKEWLFFNDWEANEYRYKYSNERFQILLHSRVFKPSVTELYHPPEDVHAYRELLHKIPGEKYQVGFNPEAGDSVLFKTSNKGQLYDHTLRRL